MNVLLSEHWQEFLRSKIQSGQFTSEAEVIEASLRLLQNLGRDPESPQADSTDPTRKPIWDRIQERSREVSDEEFLKLPADGAEQHDHYIYGTPKRLSFKQEGFVVLL